jgi:hypothetical protein
MMSASLEGGPSMNAIRVLALSAWLVLAAAPACADEPLPASKKQAAAAWSEDGLQRVEARGLDVVYARPGASLASFTRVWIRPVAVSFRRDWERAGAPGGHGRLRSTDAERIKAKLSGLVRDALLRRLEDGGYALVDGPGDDVLDVQLSIIDLYVTAPDVPTAGRVEVYAVSAGEMSLVAELRDSVSGEVVTRAFDHQRARETMRPERITRVDNAAEAEAAAQLWAKALREVLDAARAPASN